LKNYICAFGTSCVLRTILEQAVFWGLFLILPETTHEFSSRGTGSFRLEFAETIEKKKLQYCIVFANKSQAFVICSSL